MAKGIHHGEQCPTCGGICHESLLKGLCPTCLIASLQPLSREGASPTRASEVAALGELVPGSRLGDYEILEELDRGGMGIVYRAYQHGLAREVALKVLPLARRPTDDEIVRFRAEAEAAAMLSHPHIVAIFEVSQIGSVHFFSMQLIRGNSLADPLNGPRFRPGDPRPGESSHEQQIRIARLMVTIAGAIHHAHQRGILHRDLKPKNILMDHEGNPYVSDFGLARRLKTHTGMTLTGGLVGTPEYMSPEQAESPSRVREATDVYSLGVILYELLTHRPPFVGATPLDTVAQAREQEPAPLRTSARPVEPDLETICLKCLRKYPNERYSSALALSEDLKRFVDGHPIHARPASQVERFWKWTHRNPVVASLAASVVLLLLTTSLVLSYLTAKLSINAVRLEDSNRNANFELSNSDRHSHIFLHKEARLAVLRAAVSQTDSAVNSAVEELFTHDFSTNPTARIHAAGGEEILFSPHFRFFARVSNGRTNGIYETTRSTGAPVWQKTLPSEIDQVYFAPDERVVAIVYDNELVEFVDLERSVVLFTARDVGVVTFSSDSRIALAAGYNRQHRFFDIESGKTIESKQLPSFRPNHIAFDPDPESDIVAGLGANGATFWNWKTATLTKQLSYSVTPLCLAWAGDEFFVGFENGEIEYWNLRSGMHRRLVGHQRGVGRMEVSQDGQWLLSHSDDQESILWNVTDASLNLRSLDSRITQLRDDGMAVAYQMNGKTQKDREWFVSPALPARGLVDVNLRDDGSDRVRSLAFRPQGNALLAARQAGIHQLTSKSGGPPVFQPMFGTVGAAFTPDQEELFVASRRELTWFRPGSHSGRSVVRATLPSSENRWFGYGSASTSGRYCLPDAGGGILVINLTTQQVIKELPIRGVYRVGLSPSGRFMATTKYHEEKIDLWDLSDLSVTNQINRFPITGSRVDFSPDEKWLAVSTRSGFDIRPLTKRDKTHFVPHKSDQMAPATFSPNGVFLAVGADRGGISLISAQGWTNILELRDQAAFYPTELAFSADSRYLAAGTSGGMVRIWDLDEIGDYLGELHLRRWPPRVHVNSEEFPSEGPLHSVPWQSIFRNIPTNSNQTEEPANISSYQILLAGHPTNRISQQLTGFPTTLAIFKGILFDTRHTIQLSCRNTDPSGPRLENVASGIPIHQTCHRMHFLGNLDNALSAIPRLTPVAYLNVHYQNGQTASVPIRTDVDLSDWWENPWKTNDTLRATVAWRGFNKSSEENDKGIRVNLYSWTNPLPDLRIETIDLESAHEVPSLFVVGITVEP